MKRNLFSAIALAASLVLVGCASPRNATIKDGEVSNLTSAEATTLMKKDLRQKKVADVQINQKPIVRLTAQNGKPITIDAGVFEVFVPLDLAVLMSEEADAVSENVQMFREVRGVLKETVVPLAVAAALLESNKADAQASKEVALDAGETRRAELAANGALNNNLASKIQRDPLVLQVPMGSTVLTGGAPVAAAPVVAPVAAERPVVAAE